MIRSAFYILVLLVVSVIRSTQNHHLGSIPGHGEWISSSLNSENEPVAEVEINEVPNEETLLVNDASRSSNDIKDVANHDGPIPADDLLNQFSNEVKLSDDKHKSDLVGISQQLGTALYDNSRGKANALMKGIWHAVELGLAGSSQRKRSVKKASASGIAKGILNSIRRMGKWLCGLITSDEPESDEAKPIDPTDGSLITITDNNPESFDARKAWPKCRDLISSIRDQGHVGSSWAVAAVSMLSDRLCIASEGIHKKLLSSEDLMRCCPECVVLEEGAVEGGDMYNMVVFLKDHGIVTGGDYGSLEGCMPYSYPPYNHADFRDERQKNAECEGKCSNTKYKILYDEDKYFIGGYEYYTMPKDVEAIKENLMAKGSCIAIMQEYDDFYWNYKKGTIYARTEGSEYVNDHVIRLIGWGKENGIDYWLVANSRGEKWGEGGTAKINMVSGCEFGQHTYCFKPKIPEQNTEAGIELKSAT